MSSFSKSWTASTDFSTTLNSQVSRNTELLHADRYGELDVFLQLTMVKEPKNKIALLMFGSIFRNMVAQLVEALCYEPEGRGFDSR
jgi:hypothetical protein